MSCLISASIFEVLMRQDKLDAPLSYFFIGKKILFVAYGTFSLLRWNFWFVAMEFVLSV